MTDFILLALAVGELIVDVFLLYLVVVLAFGDRERWLNIWGWFHD